MRLGLFGGGFKPFTRGHESKLDRAVQMNDRVILYYGLTERKKGSDFTYTEAMAQRIYEITKAAIERNYGGRVTVLEGVPTPIARIFGTIGAVATGIEQEPADLSLSGISPDDVDSVTVYTDPTDVKTYTRHVGTPNERKYFGDTVSSGKLKFDAVTTSDVRGSDVRRFAAAGDREQIDARLPTFLTQDERNEVTSMLTSSQKRETTLRQFVSLVLD